MKTKLTITVLSIVMLGSLVSGQSGVNESDWFSESEDTWNFSDNGEFFEDGNFFEESNDDDFFEDDWFQDSNEESESDQNETNSSIQNLTVIQDEERIDAGVVTGDIPVRELYRYQLPQDLDTENQTENGAFYVEDGGTYESVADQLQKNETSTLFIYDGPEGMSLVTIHEGAESSDGGSVSWKIEGLSEERWIVKDDLYLNENGSKADSNYDIWNTSQETQEIHWTWGDAGTDGGVHRLDSDFNITITPQFNEESKLYEEHYNGDVENWEMLSGDLDQLRRTNLNMSQAITIQS